MEAQEYGKAAATTAHSVDQRHVFFGANYTMAKKRRVVSEKRVVTLIRHSPGSLGQNLALRMMFATSPVPSWAFTRADVRLRKAK